MTQVGNYQITIQPNSKNWDGLNYAPKGLGSAMSDHLDSAYGGPFQFLQLLDKTCKVFKLTTEHKQYFSDAGKLLQPGWSMAVIPYVPRAIMGAQTAVCKLFSGAADLPGALARRILVVIRECATAISAVGYAASPFLKIAEKTSEIGGKFFAAAEGAKTVADASGFVEGSRGLYNSWTLCNQAQETESCDPELQIALTDTFRLNMLKVMKSTCSVAGFILGLTAVSASFVAMPAYAIGIAGISLAGSLFGFAASIYPSQMKYKEIDIYDAKHATFTPPVDEGQIPETA